MQEWCDRLQLILNMEPERSKIPVFTFQQPRTISVLKDSQLCNFSNPQGLNKGSELPKDPVFTFNAKKNVNQRLVKTGKKSLVPPAKKGMTAATQSPANRYRWEAELRNRNRLLETAKCDLDLKVAEIQKEMKDMKGLCDMLEKENDQLKKFRESCLLILETRNWDPVTGEKMLEEEEEKKERQTEIMVLSEKLKANLEFFIQMAKEEKENLQKAQTRWKQIEEERIRFLQQQQSFDREIEELLAALNQEENCLNTSNGNIAFQE